MIIFLKTTLTVLVIATIVVLVFSFYLLYLNTHPPRCTLNLSTEQYRADYLEIWFANDEGLKLKGWLVKGNQDFDKLLPTIIFCHGLGSNKSDFIDLARHLVYHGYNAFLFDLRAHGESEGSSCSLGLYEQSDLKAALDCLIKRDDIDPERIGIFGFSLGGAIALMAAANDKRIAAVLSDSSFDNLKEQSAYTLSTFYHLPSFLFMPLASFIYRIYFKGSMDLVSPIKNVSKISPRALMFICGEKDTQIPPDSTKKLFAMAKEPKALWSIPGANHGETISIDQGHYRKRVLKFFDQYVKDRSPDQNKKIEGFKNLGIAN